MSSVGELYLEHVGRLFTGRVPDGEFYELFETNEQDVVAFGVRVLRQAIAEQDSLLVELGSYVGHRFGFSPDYLPALMHLAEVPWHRIHEDIASALSDLRDPSSVDVLYRTALVDYPHVDHEFEPLAVKCLWALSGIGNEPALLRLDQLARCGNELIEQKAVEQLARVLAKPPSEAIRALAAKLLEQRDRIQGFLDTAFHTHNVALLELALAAGRRLGFDSRTVEPLLGLAQVRFHQRHDEAIAALASVGSEEAVRALDELTKSSERRATATQALTRMADDPALTHEVRASAHAASSRAGTV